MSRTGVEIPEARETKQKVYRSMSLQLAKATVRRSSHYRQSKSPQLIVD